MTLYRFLTGPDDETFCKRVSQSLNNGWKLHGSPALTHDGKTAIAGQAMVKEVEGKDFSDDIDLKKY